MSMSLLLAAPVAFVPPVPCSVTAMRGVPIEMMAGMTRKQRKAAANGLDTKSMKGKVVPTGYVSKAPLAAEASPPAPSAAPAVAPAAERVAAPAVVAPVPAPEPTPTSPVAAPQREAAWNPKRLEVSMLPKVLQEQFAPEYVTKAPLYLDGSMPGDNGFDPWGVVSLAAPTLETDQFARTAAERDAKMQSKTAEEQQQCLAWMRESETKHGRLAMLAAAGWPLAELQSGAYMRVTMDNNGRAPSLFNGHLAEFAGPLVLFAGAMAVLEVRNKDKLVDGDLGFDPLGFGGKQRPAGALPFGAAQSMIDKLPNTGDMEALRLAEVKNGRLAMMAITGMAVQEFVYGTPVVEQTPFFFGR